MRAGRPRSTHTSYSWTAAAHNPHEAKVSVYEDASNGTSQQQLYASQMQGKHFAMQTLFTEEVEHLIAAEVQARYQLDTDTVI